VKARQPTSALLHELQVHQIDLEMQNEELRRDQLELETTHEQYVDLYDFAPVGYLTLDANGLVTGANLTAAALLGKERKGLVGRPFPGLVVGTDADRWHLFYSVLVAQEGKAACRLALGRGDGSTFDAHLACERRGDSSAGSPVRIILTDVTEFARMERSLVAVKERLSYVLDGSNDGFWDWELRSGHVKFSRRWASMLGYDLDELEPHVSSWERLVHPDDIECAKASVGAHLRGETDLYEGVHRARHRDGRWVWILDRGKVVERDAQGGPVRMAGTHTDITERKEAEAALEKSENRFRLLANVTAIGIFQTGTQGQILFVNPTYLELTGLSEAEAYGPDGKMAIHPDDRERVVREWEEAVLAGASFSAEYRHRLPDGTVNWVRMFGTPFLDDAGAVAGYVGALVDITEPRALQSQLALASRLAALGTLVTGVAHEINNPLAAEMADQGMALEVVGEVRDRLNDSAPLDRKAEAKILDGAVEALRDAQEGGHRIARIVKDLAVFGRPDSERTRVRMLDVVNGALRWLPAAVARTASIQVEDGGAPDILASSGQIEQVLVNLVTNAAWATPEGRRDTIVVRFGPGGPGMARLEVVDHGKGIEPSILEQIFEPFFTTHAVGVGKGMGLGLSISHAIVANHGGTLTVTSEVGKGSTFRMEVPAAPVEL
jgi:PAS domain S-box-containing protein